MSISAPATRLSRKRFLLVARYYSIEPLGILYLAGIMRDAGWDCEVVLVKEFDFGEVYDAVRLRRPDLVGFQIWTGYHKPAFVACDQVRAMGASVVIGGPHATYFDEECAAHADFVIKGSGFGLMRRLLLGDLPAGIHFNVEARSEFFPQPNRDLIYERYPQLGASPIKSIFGSVGCPMTCTYCYAPAFNQMHGGFQLSVRPVDELVAEARGIMSRWPLAMVYFQDDIFGYNKQWVEEFSRRWKVEVGVPFHCQIRLELTRYEAGDRRLDLLVQAGCSGITLAIESGSEFLRDRVLFRHMPDELIVEGCRKILDRGMTLRTEQILAVPFSDTATDLATLELNNRINPTMAWTSILAPYAGTDMGTIARNFAFYQGNNDDLTDSFFDRSVLRHIAGGPRDIELIVKELGINAKAPPKDQPLVNMTAAPRDDLSSEVVYDGRPVGTIMYLSDTENNQYVQDTVRLQRLFNWLARIPQAENLGKRLVEVDESQWDWRRIGKETEAHLRTAGYGEKLEDWKHALAREMQLSIEGLPEPVAQNLAYFIFLPAGGVLAAQAVAEGVFSPERSTQQVIDDLGTLTRRHLFHYDLYKIEAGAAPIAA